MPLSSGGVPGSAQGVLYMVQVIEPESATCKGMHLNLKMNRVGAGVQSIRLKI